MANLYFYYPQGLTSAIRVDVEGDINHENVSELQSKLQEVWQHENKQYWIFDLAKLSFIGSGGIGIFLELIKKSKTEAKTIFLTNLNGQIKDVLELVGIDQITNVAKTSGEALNVIVQSKK